MTDSLSAGQLTNDADHSGRIGLSSAGQVHSVTHECVVDTVRVRQTLSQDLSLDESALQERTAELDVFRPTCKGFRHP